jgi:hypothetical protein
MEHADLSVDKNFQFFYRFSVCSICDFVTPAMRDKFCIFAFKKTFFITNHCNNRCSILRSGLNNRNYNLIILIIKSYTNEKHSSTI